MMYTAKILSINNDEVKQYVKYKYSIDSIVSIELGEFNNKKVIKIRYSMIFSKYLTKINIKYINYDEYILEQRRIKIEKIMGKIK